MNKVQKLFNSIMLAFVLICFAAAGLHFSDKRTSLTSSAEGPNYEQISNDLPQYLDITLPDSGDAANAVGHVGNEIFLMQSGSNVNLSIAKNDFVTNPNPTDENDPEKNYAYIPDDASPDEYYYFRFQNDMSLYFNLTNTEIAAGATGENLMQGQSIENYRFESEKPFVPNGQTFAPQKLDVDFKLNTSISDEEMFDKNTVTLNREGCYTLVISVNYLYTNNGGVTFVPGSATINYTFMMFNSNTYFDTVTGLPNIKPNASIQSTTLTTSDTYSMMYFYNYAYALDVNNLPSFTFNPDIYQITVTYTDIDQRVSTVSVVYRNGQFVQIDSEGNEVSPSFVQAVMSGEEARLIMFDLGSYDLSFQYLYKTNVDGVDNIYELPLADELEGNNQLQNKSQRLYVYGYQAVYSDLANIDPSTNQPSAVELKTFDLDTAKYVKTADITSAMNSYIKENEVSAASDHPYNNINMASPSYSSNLNANTLKEIATRYINSADAPEPVSTNQTPVKFLSNAILSTNFSYYYKVIKGENGLELSDDRAFEGFNQSEPGVYLYIVQYQYDNYMSETGTLQREYFHYQVFYFEITNTIPSVTVLDSDFDEVYTSGYTNKSVYILNNARNNEFDANVTITLSAYDYSTRSYFFNDTPITELSSYGFAYRQFEMSVEEGDEEYNENVGGKYGILIDNSSRYSNALFTVKINSVNSEKPSVRTFTIDTNEITIRNPRNVSYSSSTTYRIGSEISSYNTNNPLIFSWDDKSSTSGAATYGRVKYLPMTEINYYSSQTSESTLSQLLYYWVNKGILPVSYKIDLAASSSWTEYANSAQYTSTIDATYVKSNNGFYILEVYDQAGNSSFGIYLIDNSSPVFVLHSMDNMGELRQILTSGGSLSVPEEISTTLTVEWAENKAIYIDNIEEYTNITPYPYTEDYSSALTKLSQLLSSFFSVTQNSDNLFSVTDISTPTVNEGSSASSDQVSTGITNYNGTYLKIGINDISYIKSPDTDTYQRYQDISRFELDLINDQGMANEGTYKFLLRDGSNTISYNNELYNYTNYPSGFLTFNITSDDAKLTVYRQDGDERVNLDYASFSLNGNLYSYDDNGETVYTHLPPNSTTENGDEYVESDLTYKFTYFTPINADDEISVSFIPRSEKGSVLQSVYLTYYEYEKKYEKVDGRYYYYYDIKDEYTLRIPLYEYSSAVVVEEGEEYTRELGLGTGGSLLAGRYVIEREYVQDNETSQYDFFRRTITFDVDDFSLISQRETVQTEIGPDGEQASSLESIVGGDIILSMYSGEGNSSIQVSFPSYNESGLQNGSFYTKESFGENEDLSIYSVAGNKLPMSLYVPKYKYTVMSQYNEDTNSYSASYNNNLSYYGKAQAKQDEGDGLWYVYVEGVKLSEAYQSQEAAQQYIEQNITIKDYELKVEVIANVVENGRTVTKYYYSNGNVANGYLLLYEVSERNQQVPENATPAEPFYLAGSYVVTLYQSSHAGTSSAFYDLYKFGFEIVSQEPDFTLIGSDGYEISSVGNERVSGNTADVYYTNSSEITVQWEMPTSQYMAKIDEEHITINSYPNNRDLFEVSSIEGSGNIRYLTIECENLLNTANSYLTIYMQYEGHNSTYYNQAIKRIYFDRSAPMSNLQTLMSATEQATTILTRNYQELNMRRYANYDNVEQDLTSVDQVANMSYSYSADTGAMKYYGYVVTTDFFNRTLVNTLSNATTFRYDTQYIYYTEINSLETYTQVDKNSFSATNYYRLSTNGDNELVAGYYEIVEMDYAGNMVVYVVKLIDSSFEEDENINPVALTYTNDFFTEEIDILSAEITNGFNIYSSSGFTLHSLSYQSDDWCMVSIRIAGQSAIRYMASPWLEDGYVYRIVISASGMEMTPIALSSIFESVDSSAQKHSITFSDRIGGSLINTYLSIMDASITTQKVEDPNHTSAILNISVPTLEQYQSTTSSYIFPTQIRIYQFDNSSDDSWREIMIANQQPYGTWVPAEGYVDVQYITFTYINSTTLQIRVNLGAASSQKVKYEIVDNFGKTTPVIQLANEVSYREISGPDTIYQITESDSTVTYLSNKEIRFSYNTLLYNVTIYNSDNEDVTRSIEYEPQSNNISVYKFKSPEDANVWDVWYRIVVTDTEDGESIKTIQVRLYYALPYLSGNATDVMQGGITFVDKNNTVLALEEFTEMPNTTVYFNGRPYTATAQTVTTYSQTVRVNFPDGSAHNYEGVYHYRDGYSYSVYLSNDNGQTWSNVTSSHYSNGGCALSGTGEYWILIKYDSEEYFTNLCQIFKVSILDSSTSYYYITVDGLPVSKSEMKYTDRNGVEHDTNYIVSVSYDDKFNRIQIVANEDLDVSISAPTVEYTDTDICVEIYNYVCSESRGDFTIIYIEPTNDILSEFTYTTTSGQTESLETESFVFVDANKDTESTFDRLRLDFTAYYGIEQNKVNIEVNKLFNGSYVKINPTIYPTSENKSYIYLDKAGTYRIRLYDSCNPANVQMFQNSQYIDLIFLNTVPFTVTYTDSLTGEQKMTESVNNAVYNGNVTLNLTNLTSYYLGSGYPVISVKLNGRDYTGYQVQDYSYSFTQPGYYSVTFTATSRYGTPLREEEFNFVLMNENESRYAYEFVQYRNYYIESVIKDGVDITQNLINIGNFETVNVDGKTYLSQLLINYLDSKTGSGRYQITVNTNDNSLGAAADQTFTFKFWINMNTPPLEISLKEGDSTTKNITVRFNVANLYNAMGDCYIQIGSDRYEFTSENLGDYGENYVITIQNTGTYFIQVYSMSGQLMYSYKVIKSEPLNAFAIIAIVIGVAAVIAIIWITVSLRKRQKVK